MKPDIEASFSFQRETKNTYRYVEEPDDGEKPVVGYLYIRKSALDGNPPERLKAFILAE